MSVCWLPAQASVTVNVNIVQSLTDLINAVGGGPVVVAARNAILATLITLGVTQINLGTAHHHSALLIERLAGD